MQQQPQQLATSNVFVAVRWIFAVGGLFAIAIGVAFVVMGWNEVRTAQESSSWPSTRGVVTDSKTIFAAAPASRRSDRHHDSGGWKPHIEYEYGVQGQTLRNDRISFGIILRSANRADAQRIAIGYPPGAEVTVYYNPADPAESVLTPGAPPSAFLPLGLGLAAMAMGGAFTWFAWRFLGRSNRVQATKPTPRTEALLTALRPTPRALPVTARIHTLTGGALNQAGWILLLVATVGGIVWFGGLKKHNQSLADGAETGGMMLAIIAAMLIGVGLAGAVRKLRLLTWGATSLGRLVSAEETNHRINGKPAYRLTFEFDDDDGVRRTLHATTNTPERHDKSREEVVLYDPSDRSNAALLTLLPVKLSSNESGNLVHANLSTAWWCLVAPGLSLLATACLAFLLTRP